MSGSNHSRDQLIMSGRDLPGKAAFGESAAKPAGAQAKIGGEQDQSLHLPAEILQFLLSILGRADEKSGCAFGKTVGTELAQVLPVIFLGRN